MYMLIPQQVHQFLPPSKPTQTVKHEKNQFSYDSETWQSRLGSAQPFQSWLDSHMYLPTALPLLFWGVPLFSSLHTLILHWLIQICSFREGWAPREQKCIRPFDNRAITGTMLYLPYSVFHVLVYSKLQGKRKFKERGHKYLLLKKRSAKICLWLLAFYNSTVE